MKEFEKARHLLCITGLTPQVVTETVYALYREGPSAIPTHIHLISTAEGIDRARLLLLSDKPGWFEKLRTDHGLPPIQFGLDNLHVLTGADGQPLRDIRNGDDNTAAADGITEWVRKLTLDENSELHVSLAGGRKTLGFFAGYALSLFGRPQDRLSHVLVDAPFESHPEFFYPTPYPHIIFRAGPDQKPLDTQDAGVTLADIPFVRLRHGLPDSLLKGRGSFSGTVRAAQKAIGPARLEFDLASGTVIAGDICLEGLPPAELAYFAWLARRALMGLEPLLCPPDGVPDTGYASEFLAEYRCIVGELGSEDRVMEALGNGMEKGYFERRKSRLNRMLREALGPSASLYEIKAFGQRPRTRFGVRLDPGQILFGN